MGLSVKEYRKEVKKAAYEVSGGSAMMTLKQAAVFAGQKNPRRALQGIFYGLPRTPGRGLYTDDVVDAICRERNKVENAM